MLIPKMKLLIKKTCTNPSKLSLAKKIATFVSAFVPKLAKQGPKHPTDWIILDIWALLTLISVDI